MEEKIRFGEIVYRRPDFKKMQDLINSTVEKINNLQSYEELKKCIFEYQDNLKSFNDLYTIVSIRHFQDATDEFYEKESEECDREMSMIDTSAVAKAILESPYVDRINEEFGSEYLAKVESDMKVHAKGKELQAEEGVLIGKYQQLKAKLTFNFQGKTMSEGEINPWRKNPDREVRRAATEAIFKGYASKAQEFEEILEKLIKVRNELAKANGYATYPEYMDEEKGRRGYCEAELNSFCEEVRKELTPFLLKMRKKQAESIGVDRITAYDDKVYFIDGNAKPKGSTNDLLKAASTMYHGLSKEAGEFFDDMVETDFIDCAYSDKKISGMGFATYLEGSGKSFIFANNNGTTSDVEVVTHEVGHAFAAYKAMENHKLSEYICGTNDIVEVPSMTMEYFAYPYLKEFFGEDAEKYKYGHMIEAFARVCFFCMTNLFENYIYLNPDISMKERIDEYNRLNDIFDPGVDASMFKEYIDGGVRLFKSMGVYMFPKYLISYSLSEIGAMAFMQRYSEDRKKAWEDYVTFCKAGGSKPYVELLEIAGLEVPFKEGAVGRATKYIRELLEEMCK